MPPSPPATTLTASSAASPIVNAAIVACSPPTERPSSEFSGAWSASVPPIAVASASATPRSISGSLGGEPVRPDPCVDHPRRIQVGGADHLGRGDLGGLLRLLLGPLEQQLVVDLQDHPRREPGGRQRVVAAHHRHLDDVGRRALDDRV